LDFLVKLKIRVIEVEGFGSWSGEKGFELYPNTTRQGSGATWRWSRNKLILCTNLFFWQEMHEVGLLQSSSLMLLPILNCSLSPSFFLATI